jgi:HEAT repeat protein
MVAYHISRLKDKNSAVRLKSINELALLGDPDALEALQEVYQNDTDSEVRKAAQEAGRAIFLKQKQQQRS